MLRIITVTVISSLHSVWELESLGLLRLSSSFGNPGQLVGSGRWNHGQNRDEYEWTSRPKLNKRIVSKETRPSSFALRGIVRSKLLPYLFTMEIDSYQLVWYAILSRLVNTRWSRFCAFVPSRLMHMNLCGGILICVKKTPCPLAEREVNELQFKMAAAGERWPNNREQIEL